MKKAGLRNRFWFWGHLAVWYFMSGLSAQSNSFFFERLRPQDEISQYSISAMLQDQKGFLWFGTWSGLWRYDGYQFRHFDHRSGLLSSKITCLYEDARGTLWVGTRNTGLYQFDADKEVFLSVPLQNGAGDLQPVQNITSVFQDRNGFYWIGAEEGLLRYHPEQKRVSRVRLLGVTPAPSDNLYLYTIGQTARGGIWIGGSHGFYICNQPMSDAPTAHQIPLHTEGASEREKELHNFVYTVQPKTSEPDLFWVGAKSGLKLLRLQETGAPTGTLLRTYAHAPNNPLSLSHDFVTSVCESHFPKPGSVWVATFNGLNLLDENSGQFRRFFPDDRPEGSLLAGHIRCLLFDRSGILWIGTHRGVNKLNPRWSDFSLFPLQKNAKSGSETVCHLSQTTQNIWAGTLGGGIFRIPLVRGAPQWQDAVHYDLTSANKSPVTNYISALVPDGKGYIWCLTQGAGAFRFKESAVPPGGGIITGAEQFTKGGGELQTGDDYLMSGLAAPCGKVWIGCWDAGLNLYNPATQRFHHFVGTSDGLADFHLYPIIALLETTEQGRPYIWAGTRGGGLFQMAYNDTTHQLSLVRRYHREGQGASYMEDNFITSLSLDEEGNLWVSTETGLFRRAQHAAAFKAVSNLHLYAQQGIESLIPVGKQSFWVSTPRGIGFFQWQDQAAVLPAMYYEARNGLRERAFHSNTSLRLPGGLLLFGGSSGITTFQPEQVRPDTFAGRAVITGMRLFNRPVIPGEPFENGFLLERSLLQLPALTLSHQDNVVSFEFSGLHYGSPEQNRFAYQLKGFDPDWIYTDAQQRLAHYTNLPPGHYTFMVKSANSDGVWSEDAAQLRIRVLPPWWRSGWAYVLYLLAFAGLLWLVRKLTLLRASFENQIQMERLEKQKMEEVNQMKFNFFTNISHELKTPLTLILSPLEDMVRNRKAGNQSMHQTLAMMHRNAARLLDMINQLLDIRKAEAGLMKLEAGKGNVVQFITEICLSFRELAQQRQIALHLTTGKSDIQAWFDPDQLEKVFFNLLSNALKYTAPGGRVEVEVNELPDQGRYYVRVSDNGKGIPEDKLPLIFERFFRVEEAEKTGEAAGVGIGLSLVKTIAERHHGAVEVESTLGKGAVFTVYLPLGDEPFTSDEKRRPTIHGEERNWYPPAEAAAIEPAVADPEATDLPHLLLVEDNPDIREYLVQALSDHYLVTEAADGMEGLEKTKELLPDLVLCDISMPGMDGLELTRRLKNEVATSHIPIVLLTARTSLVFKVNGLESGADDYITKPFNLKLLQARIQNLIESRARLRERYAQNLQGLLPQPEEPVFPEMDDGFLKAVEAIVEERLEDPEFSVDHLARKLLMNRKQVYRKIKALTNQTPNEYIRSLRLKRAAALLRTHRYTIAEVTYKVGFQDLKYFRERFRDFFGVNPSELEQGE